MIPAFGKKNRVFSILLASLVFHSANFSWAIPREGHKIMMATPSPIAAEVGRQIAAKGGNVVDVAVAIGLSLSVTSPYFASLGGGGFALIKMGKNPVQALDFREAAPAKTHPKFFLDKPKTASIDGPHAVGVPGFPAGLWAMHKKYGKLHWSQLFEAPIRLAKKGFPVSGEWVDKTSKIKNKFNGAGKRFLLKKNRSVYRPREILKQPQLAKALKEMRNRGVTPFYKGSIARDISKTLKDLGGVMTFEDFKNYKVRWLKPLQTNFAGHKVYLMPPPSSGGLIIHSALQLIEKLKLKKYKALSVDELHFLAEIMKVAFRGRSLLGDPDFHKNPTQHFTDAKELKKIAEKIKANSVLKLKPIETAMNGSKETTHYSVMDIHGNTVSLTVTLNGNYGSKVVSEKFGIALNNEMDDFTTRPGKPNMFGLIQGKGNHVQAGKRPLSSMSPTLVEKNGKVVLSLGGKGGPRIINGVLQTLYRVLVSGYDMDLAIQTPRIHHQFLPDTIYYDTHRFSPEVIEALEKRGHKLKESWQAKVYGVRINEEGHLEAAYDSRSEGGANGI